MNKINILFDYNGNVYFYQNNKNQLYQLNIDKDNKPYLDEYHDKLIPIQDINIKNIIQNEELEQEEYSDLYYEENGYEFEELSECDENIFYFYGNNDFIINKGNEFNALYDTYIFNDGKLTFSSRNTYSIFIITINLTEKIIMNIREIGGREKTFQIFDELEIKEV